MSRQKEFDWTRARRQEWLDHLVIPAFDRVELGGVIRTVRTHRMKHLLVMIEHYTRDGKSWALKETTVAMSLGGVSVRTVRRVIADCEQCGLLEVERSPGRANSYQIAWCEVAQILLNDPKTAGLVEGPYLQQVLQLQAERQAAKRLSLLQDRLNDAVRLEDYELAAVLRDELTAETTPDNTVGTPDNLSPTPDNLTATPDNLSQTPDNLSNSDENDTSLTRARGLQPCSQPCSQPEIKPCYEEPTLFDFRGFHGWPFTIERKHLQDASQVQRLWEHALDCSYVLSDCRVRFFTLAICVAEMPEVKNHGGFFTRKIKQKKWLGSRSHIKRALEAIARLEPDDIGDRKPSGPPPSKNVADAIDKLRKRFGIEGSDSGKAN